MQRVADCGHLADRIQQTVVVNEVFIAHGGHIHTSGIQLACVRQAFFAKNIVSSYLDQGWRQPLQLLGGRLEW